jgi:hypothetical protein
VRAAGAGVQGGGGSPLRGAGLQGGSVASFSGSGGRISCDGGSPCSAGAGLQGSSAASFHGGPGEGDEGRGAAVALLRALSLCLPVSAN